MHTAKIGDLVLLKDDILLHLSPQENIELKKEIRYLIDAIRRTDMYRLTRAQTAKLEIVLACLDNPVTVFEEIKHVAK